MRTLWPRWVSLVGLAVLVGVLVWLFLVGAVMMVPHHDSLTAYQRTQAVTDSRRTLLAVFAGIGAGAGLWYTDRRHRLDRDANATDRYTKAVEQIADDKLAVRLGGIYALERLAFDSDRDRNTILNVLCAYVRDRTMGPGIAGLNPAVDIQAALTVIAGKRGSELWHSSKYLIGRAYLSGAYLSGADLSDANLYRANLAAANLAAANLNGTDLSATDLSAANLSAADLTGADLSFADLSDVDLSGAQLRRAHLIDANLTGADLSGADLSAVILIGADLSSVDLSDVGLTGAVMRSVRLTGTQWREAKERGAMVDETAPVESAPPGGAG